MAGNRVADHAEILAAHYTTALDLAQAAKDPSAAELAATAARYLILAGDRAMGIDVEAGERHRRSWDRAVACSHSAGRLRPGSR